MGGHSKQVLIESGARIFAQKGYVHTKVADIAQDANANIAAVNYHFKSKENLFIEALRYAFDVANTKYPIMDNLGGESAPLVRIQAFARALLKRSFDEGVAGDFNRMMCKTVHTPGSPIERIMLEVRELECDAVDLALKEYFKGQSQFVVDHAKVNLVSLATIVSKYPFLTQSFLNKSSTDFEIAQFIEIQVSSITASLHALLPEPSL